ncbi:NAD(P) transhydrogenase subunit alpha [Rhizobium tibeticum]|uniref:proton-translocating NAD(P)(+) transhydrogenase n=1 Tax=Rhizobium tibeticum TaxID=501024 RepID=A0A1H8J4M5_9HYPH|nr:NAD/NADP transhydrogenase subunit alpha [Rhizobium tibeticum]SEH74697.1 NAD(P) transhydrogenase subunit alpha part 1 [Rhizobium tibeticum]SEN75744.1 NAD(P) transhydrogenase subunit alpha [Rhizobium tibeticum]
MSNVIRVRAGLLRETHPGERRVALTPDDVRRLCARMSIRFERSCGIGAGHADDAYIAAGAEPAEFAQMASSSDVFVSVRRPAATRIFPATAVLIFLGSNAAPVTGLPAGQRPLHLDIARLSGMQGVKGADISSRQAAITGHAAILEAARQFGISHPMLMVDGSFVRPVRMAALGSDAASLQALATARRLGALTHGFGLERDTQAKIERLGAKFLGMSADLARLRQELCDPLSKMQLITTNVVIPGQTAPMLLDETMLSRLSPGTVIVDLAAESGGNCALMRVDETINVFGVRIIGSATLASHEAAEASRHFSDGLRNLLEHLIDADCSLRLDPRDSMTAALMNEETTLRRVSP